jgi:hypothetical protein
MTKLIHILILSFIFKLTFLLKCTREQTRCADKCCENGESCDQYDAFLGLNFIFGVESVCIKPRSRLTNQVCVNDRDCVDYEHKCHNKECLFPYGHRCGQDSVCINNKCQWDSSMDLKHRIKKCRG